MIEIKNSIENDDIQWNMDWRDSKAIGYAKDKPDIEVIFESGMALAHLLMNEVVSINSYWWKHHNLENPRWTIEESKKISIAVICNDVFNWAAGDAEPLPYLS